MQPPPRAYTNVVPTPPSVVLNTIGRVHSPFTERHGTPRQPGLVGPKEAGLVDARVVLDPDWVDPLAIHDLDAWTHIWLIGVFHLNGPRRRPLVRPPRGGPKRGTLATRSPHRMNPIALSAVRLLAVDRLTLHVRGIDLLDGTPILDIKPYVPDFDALADAGRGWLP